MVQTIFPYSKRLDEIAALLEEHLELRDGLYVSPKGRTLVQIVYDALPNTGKYPTPLLAAFDKIARACKVDLADDKPAKLDKEQFTNFVVALEDSVMQPPYSQKNEHLQPTQKLGKKRLFCIPVGLDYPSALITNILIEFRDADVTSFTLTYSVSDNERKLRNKSEIYLFQNGELFGYFCDKEKKTIGLDGTEKAKDLLTILRGNMHLINHRHPEIWESLDLCMKSLEKEYERVSPYFKSPQSSVGYTV